MKSLLRAKSPESCIEERRRAVELAVVILAAGQGTRMKSRLPKVLHPLAGRPL
ncbi:MAG: hypothetical protein DRI80_00785, partial [Chloroflexota bacterium]